jgi:(2Fe-2S) ferredoxin
MLTDQSWLKQGQLFPPACEQERLSAYKAHRDLFESRHSEVYKAQQDRLDRDLPGFMGKARFVTIFNYQRLMALKMADLIFGEPPSVSVPDTSADTKRGMVDTEKQQIIDKIIKDTDLFGKGYTAAIDLSRYGDSILVLGKQDDKLTLDTLSPRMWYPVVDPQNIKRIIKHVLAWTNCVDKARKVHHLFVEIHDPTEIGKCEKHEYVIQSGSGEGWKIGAEVRAKSKDHFMSTNLDFCPIFRVSNVQVSDSIYGLDDFDPIDSLVSELIVRISQISMVLDKHASPSMSGPGSALVHDEMLGTWKLLTGGYYTRNSSEDPEPKYLTWDGNLDAAFKQIEVLTNQLYAISEMGAAVFGDLSNSTGTVPSGSALRRLMISPLAKAARVARQFDPVLKRILSAGASLYGADIAPEEITIKWNDGLPDDEVEQANLMAVRTGNQPTLSQYSALQRMDGMSPEDIESELEQIREESAGRTPPALSLFSPRADAADDTKSKLEDSS